MCIPCFGRSETGAVGCDNKMNVSFLLFLNRLVSLQTMHALLRNATLVGLLCFANIYYIHNNGAKNLVGYLRGLTTTTTTTLSRQHEQGPCTHRSVQGLKDAQVSQQMYCYLLRKNQHTAKSSQQHVTGVLGRGWGLKLTRC